MRNKMAGQRFDDPFYFIQQPFTLLGEIENVHKDWDEWTNAYLSDDLEGTPKLVHEYDQYQNVTFNIWLFKGTHHFIQCLEHLVHKYATYDYDLTTLNSDMGYYEDEELESFKTLCKYDANFFPLQRT